MLLARMLREELNRLPGVQRTITSTAKREVKSDISFPVAVVACAEAVGGAVPSKIP